MICHEQRKQSRKATEKRSSARRPMTESPVREGTHQTSSARRRERSSTDSVPQWRETLYSMLSNDPVPTATSLTSKSRVQTTSDDWLDEIERSTRVEPSKKWKQKNPSKCSETQGPSRSTPKSDGNGSHVSDATQLEGPATQTTHNAEPESSQPPFLDFEFIDLSPPQYRPDWRWRRVCAILERGGYATLKRDGEVVQRAVRCQRLLERALTIRGVNSATKTFPDVVMAIQLSTESILRPLEVRARALAGQSPRAIGRAVGLSGPTVATYLDLFFDVCNRLDARSWIRWSAIGLPSDDPPTIEQLMLLHCWERGPLMVAPWLDYLQHHGERVDLKTTVGRQRAGIQLFVDAQQLPRDEKMDQSLIKKLESVLLKSPKSADCMTVRGAYALLESRLRAAIAWKPNSELQVFGNSNSTDSEIRPRDQQDWAFAKVG